MQTFGGPEIPSDTAEIKGGIQAKVVKIFDIMKLFYKINVNKLLILNWL